MRSELTLAIERLGYTFYTNASKKTHNDTGRVMFQRLAAEESDHLRRLQEEYRALLDENEWLKREPARLPVSRKIAQEIFPQKDLLRYQVSEEDVRGRGAEDRDGSRTPIASSSSRILPVS